MLSALATMPAAESRLKTGLTINVGFTMLWDSLWINARIATFDAEDDYGIIEDGAIAVKQGKIAWIGPSQSLEIDADKLASNVYDVKQQWLLPGFIDCHTHIVYGGNRANEFSLRLAGKSYADIAKQGGGIQKTMYATREASIHDLYQESIKRLQSLLSEGVTGIEIKSGYGLDVNNEEKMLQVAQQIADNFPCHVQKTFLGAHAIPPEFSGKSDEYMHHICEIILPYLAKENLIDAVDVFCENIAFNLAQTRKLFQAATSLNLPVKIHAEQLSDMHGAKLAAEFDALSADHLEYLSKASIIAMAKAGTVATLLPGAFYYLQETQLPPIDLLRKHRVPIAIATDCNPGSSPCTSLLLMVNMACVLFKLTPLEALQGITRHAARALGWQDSLGSLAVGKQADFSLWAIEHPQDLAYRISGNLPNSVIYKGNSV